MTAVRTVATWTGAGECGRVTVRAVEVERGRIARTVRRGTRARAAGGRMRNRKQEYSGRIPGKLTASDRRAGARSRPRPEPGRAVTVTGECTSTRNRDASGAVRGPVQGVYHSANRNYAGRYTLITRQSNPFTFYRLHSLVNSSIVNSHNPRRLSGKLLT